VLVSADEEQQGLTIDSFYSEVIPKGKRDMAWELSSNGFLMTLSGYIPELIQEDFDKIVDRALQKDGTPKEDVSHWCVHPGGKRVLEAIHKSLGFTNGQLSHSYDVLKQFGNLSSATILFVLKEMLQERRTIKKMFGAAFGPGLTVETFTAHY
jgi:predicted naringenin-chalcone synthase